MTYADASLPDSKKCSKCGKIKSRSEFGKRQTNSRDGLTGRCKKCINKAGKDRRDNKEKLQCSVINSVGEQCDKYVSQQGMCAAHINRMRRFGDVQADIPIKYISPKGNGTIDGNGYKRYQRNGKSKLEHRMIMEEILGRSLLPGENIHHKNGDRLDNRSENLELWLTGQPKGQRVQDLMEYIAKYHADAMLEMLGGKNGLL